ncbi:hypothetical protein HNQ91_002938 [Filimonas zeae]|uniref:S1/P1 Nuclease n=1 Tax=Filimonas zeae TaxID=1737353 RepID=A0A917IY46_9BACT|nr:S1/P1 nuclease [Filimonas zeae]MDR6339873.1 hypothetical protein [Filimonas zeae]GGH70074.1 hypothetical protein GCM10011379_27990 [Filimonas zeae]
MKRNYYLCGVLLLVTVLAGWGNKGHRAVALIAEKHLQSDVKTVIQSYLDGETMEEVSTWADDHHNTYTAQWHYINLPVGLSYAAFDKAVRAQKHTVYTALLKARATIQMPGASKEKKKDALRYLIHLVADAHQPMHVSRKEDRGGNDITLKFGGDKTNMHSLWDGKLIDREGLSIPEMVAAYDNASPQQVKQWQQDSVMQWLWESYQISGQLYRELKPGTNVADAAYQQYINITRKRILLAGIRLAGELNSVLKGQKAVPVKVKPVTPVRPQQPGVATRIALKDVANAVGKQVVVSGKVFSAKDIGRMLLLNIGAAHPNQLLTVALQGKAKTSFTGNLNGKTITVTGKVILFKGKPEIIVDDPAQLQ